MSLAASVIRFAGILRTAGIPIGTDRVVDAVRMLPSAGLERRGDCHATLSALFVTRHDQQALFDEAFARFWRPSAEDEIVLPELRPRIAADAGTPGRVREAMLPVPLPRKDVDREDIRLDAALTFSDVERLKAIDFERMTLAEWEAARRALARLALPLPPVRMRRYRVDPRGPALDLRATLRGMAREGGQLVRLARRALNEAPAPLVILCDVSGSMDRYTRMFLHFAHALARNGERRVHTFLFGTRLTNVTRPMRGRDVDEALARMARLVPDWAGGTRIGAALAEFNMKWSRRVLAQNASVLLVSDGLDRGDPDTLGAQMARLKRSCRRLLWLNPLLRYDGFEPRASGVAAMLPHVDAFLPVHNLASLEDLARALTHGTHRRATPAD